jgi:glycogen synthase
MLVSVVICTYNRVDGLRATLECLQLQRFRDFEIVVVNGPSTDGTADFLRELDGTVKAVDNPAANLSISRNIGIRASAGDIVAFIDDDALPEPAWLEQAVPAFDDPEVAGVGGLVLDHTGMNPQYTYSASTRFGEGVFSDEQPFDLCCIPGAAVFPYLQGTNSLFRRSALAQIGLFDETFDFYLDETDVCCRLIDAGYTLRQIPDAPVHHKYLPSARRNEARVVTNWLSIVRNHVYFGYRHAALTASEVEIVQEAVAFRDRVLNDAAMHEALGNVEAGHVERARAACETALAEGMRIGRLGQDVVFPPVDLDPEPFLPIGPPAVEPGHRIALVSSGYTPNVTGGIARFISDVAPELARRGHEVRVFARAVGDHATVDLEDGVWAHRLRLADAPGALPDAPPAVDGFASAVAGELSRISSWWRPDVVYGSLWDVEMLGVARVMPELAVVPMLATPVAEVAEHEGWVDPRNPGYDTYVALTRLEREMIARSVSVHAISDAIVRTFERLYPGALQPGRIDVEHIGRRDELGAKGVRPPSDPPMVLFIGRLEARKGIDTFLDAARTVLAECGDVEIVVAGDASRPAPSGETYPDRWRRDGGDVTDRLSFVGAVGDQELTELLHRSSIVVMPSRYESFGLVVVEAMMFGRPAVASDVGGIAELIDDGVTGRVVPVADAAALAGALVELARDPDQRERIGRAARERFVEHLDVGPAAARLETVLARALDRARRDALVGASG